MHSPIDVYGGMLVAVAALWVYIPMEVHANPSRITLTLTYVFSVVDFYPNPNLNPNLNLNLKPQTPNSRTSWMHG